MYDGKLSISLFNMAASSVLRVLILDFKKIRSPSNELNNNF